MKRSYTIGISLVCAAALGMPSTAMAGPDRDQGETTANYSSKLHDGQMSTADRQREVAAKYRLKPESRITVAADYDNDGQFDAYETVHYYEFARVQAANQQRGQDGKAQRTKHKGKLNKDQMQATARLSGEITDLREVRLAHADEEFVLARIETDRGARPATALLGPKSRVDTLKLKQGERITVSGYRGHVNDRSMLIAGNLEAGNRKLAVDIPASRHLKRAQGEVISTRTARFRGFSQPFVVAEVELASGKREMVNLGPEARIEQLDLDRGDQVQLLVRPGRVGGEPAMIAEQVRANGQLVKLPRPQDTANFSRS